MKKKDYINYFKNKKITVMGLGLLGRGVNVSKFLAECGAELIITDLKSKEELKTSLEQLKKYKEITYVLDKHRLEDFKNRDFIIKAPNVPINSKFIEEAKKNNIPIEMDASLFVKLAKNILIIGITGTRGKSTVAQLIFEILKENNKEVFLGGNVKGSATLPLLKKVKDGDIVVLELDSWQLQGFGDSKISPNLAVFTNFMRDHMNYYKDNMEKYFSDKSNIYKYQKKADKLFVGENVSSMIDHKKNIVKNIVPSDWNIKLKGKHNLGNISFAISIAREIGVRGKIIRKVVEGFIGVSGRLELVKEENGILFYNDTNATTPDATIAALKSINGNIILISGGADKRLDYKEFSKHLHNIKKLILFSGSATDKIMKLISMKYSVAHNMHDAVEIAKENAKNGDTILLSPASASFGIFKNEFDRGNQFVKEI